MIGWCFLKLAYSNFGQDLLIALLKIDQHGRSDLIDAIPAGRKVVEPLFH